MLHRMIIPALVAGLSVASPMGAQSLLDLFDDNGWLLPESKPVIAQMASQFDSDHPIPFSLKEGENYHGPVEFNQLFLNDGYDFSVLDQRRLKRLCGAVHSKYYSQKVELWRQAIVAMVNDYGSNNNVQPACPAAEIAVMWRDFFSTFQQLFNQYSQTMAGQSWTAIKNAAFWDARDMWISTYPCLAAYSGPLPLANDIYSDEEIWFRFLAALIF